MSGCEPGAQNAPVAHSSRGRNAGLSETAHNRENNNESRCGSQAVTAAALSRLGVSVIWRRTCWITANLRCAISATPARYLRFAHNRGNILTCRPYPKLLEWIGFFSFFLWGHHMRGFAVALGLSAVAGFCTHASAAPPSEVVSQAFYVSIDSSYQHVNLPRFALGWRHLSTTAPFPDTGPTESYNPVAAGAGVSGAIGYRLPHGTLPAFLGTNARFEIGASYVKATGSQSSASAGFDATSGFGFYFPLLNGTQVGTPFQCPAGAPCGTSSTLNTRFTEWRINGKLAADHNLGGAVYTPSVAVFGGTSRSDQHFQQKEFFVGAASPNGYTADVAMRWTDVGLKFGLEARTDFTPMLALGLAGSIGVAHRDVSLDANDLFAVTFSTVRRTSAIDVNTTAVPVLGNAEARVFVTPLHDWTFKGFVGLNYDSKVPGITAPSIALPNVFGTVGPPSTVGFESVISYYGGGGMTKKFNM